MRAKIIYINRDGKFFEPNLGNFHSSSVQRQDEKEHVKEPREGTPDRRNPPCTILLGLRRPASIRFSVLVHIFWFETGFHSISSFTRVIVMMELLENYDGIQSK